MFFKFLGPFVCNAVAFNLLFSTGMDDFLRPPPGLSMTYYLCKSPLQPARFFSSFFFLALYKGPDKRRARKIVIRFCFFYFMKIHEKFNFGSYQGTAYVVRSRKKNKLKNAKGSTNTRGQRPRRAMARVLPRAPWLAADCFCRQRLGGNGSRRLLDGLAPPRRPTRAAATRI